MTADAVEREIKLDVDDEFVVPDPQLPAGWTIRDRGVHQLRARYLDTADGLLSRHHHGLRHRTTADGDGVWTLKGPASDADAVPAREEFEVPGDTSPLPPTIVAALPPGVDAADLSTVLRLETARHIRDVVDGAGVCRLELADDRVVVISESGDMVGHFRELEVEVRGGVEHAGAALDVAEQFRAAGAREAAWPSKLVRGLHMLRNGNPL